MSLPPPTAPPRSPALFFGREEELRRHASEMPRVRLAVVYGPGGVGKTAFVLRASEELAEQIGARRVWVRCRPGESASTLAAAAAAGIAGDLASHPVDALLGAGPLVLVIDDAHVAEPSVVSELAEYLVSRSAGLHVCIASRTALPLSPVAIDHLVIKLAGLEPAAASALWRALESLYGTRGGGATTAERGAGNPLLIKRAFAEAEAGADSLGLADLEPLARELVVELCAARGPVPRAALTRGRDPAALDQALRALERRFLVEPTGERYGVHDIIREAVASSPWRPGAEVHARWAERFRAGATSDEASLVELIHHLVAAGDDAGAALLLRREADILRRIPPGSTLLDREIRAAIDSLEERMELPGELRILRARVRARQGDVRAAFDELERIAGAGPLIECDRAEVAHMLGMVDRARASAGKVLADPSASPLAHARALALAVDAARTAGDVPAALALADLDTEPLRQLGPLLGGLRAWLRAVTFTDCERYGEAAVELARAKSALAGFPSATPMLSSLARSVAVLAGCEVPPDEQADELFDENALFRCVARLLAAQTELARGQNRRAAELAQQVWQQGEQMDLLTVTSWASWVWADAAGQLGDHQAVIARAPAMLELLEQAGHLPPRVRLSLALAEALLAAGQRERAVELARSAHALATHLPRTRARAAAVVARAGGGDTERDPAELGGIGAAEAALAAAERALERGDRADAGAHAARAERDAIRFGWASVACRAGLVGAELALRAGDPSSARAALERWATPALEHAVAAGHAAALARALARAAGEAPPPATPLDPRAAARLLLDDPLAIELVTEAGRALLVRAQLDEVDLSAAEWLVDRERGTVRWAGETVDLSRRTTLLDLAVALTCPPGNWLTPAELAERAWQLDYHPLKHHSRLAMAVARLRDLLGAQAIESGRAGYRLAEARRWALVRPWPDRPRLD